MTETRTFWLYDDQSHNLWIGRITRAQDEVKPELWALELGGRLATSPTTGFQRSDYNNTTE